MEPLVGRLLNVPPLVTFSDLHEAIAASFNYKPEDTTDGDSPFPWFDVLKASETDKPYAARTSLLALSPDADDVFDEDEVRNTDATRVCKIFDEHEGSRYYDKCFRYMYHAPDRIEHVLQLLGRTRVHTIGKIVCVGGQGSIALLDWKDEGPSGSKHQSGPIIGKFDLKEVNVRLAQLQKNWPYPKKIRDGSTG